MVLTKQIGNQPETKKVLLSRDEIKQIKAEKLKAKLDSTNFTNQPEVQEDENNFDEYYDCPEVVDFLPPIILAEPKNKATSKTLVLNSKTRKGQHIQEVIVCNIGDDYVCCKQNP